MEDPFFTTWKPAFLRYPTPNPTTTATARGIPVQKDAPEVRKVRSIPVHSVRHEETRTQSAVKIQSAFRGFLVRKNAKKISRIREEAERIGEEISRQETANLIRRESKERLRLNEMLMSLLLRLDSIRGFDAGIRDLRKAVIRRVISLQESVDAISTQDQEAAMEEIIDPKEEISDVADITPENSETTTSSDAILDMKESSPQIISPVPYQTENSKEEFHSDPPITETLNIPNNGEPIQNQQSENNDVSSSPSSKPCNAEIPLPEVVQLDRKDLEAMEFQVSNETLKSVGNGKDSPCLLRFNPLPSNNMDAVVDGAVEKMIEENEKLRRLLSELCERNIMQSRLMSSLAERVDQLERIVRQQELIRNKNKKKKQRVSPANLAAAPKSNQTP